jgi:hypothetical protein
VATKIAIKSVTTSSTEMSSMGIFTGDLSGEEGPPFRMVAPRPQAHRLIQVFTGADTGSAGWPKNGGVVAG